MNEKLQYEKMLDIPVSSCSVVYNTLSKKEKKKKVKDLDRVKERLIEKVNSTENECDIVDCERKDELVVTENDGVKMDANDAEFTPTACVVKKKPRVKLPKLGVIGVQLVVIGALVATIFLTSALLPNSGLNSLFAGAFKSETVLDTQVDDRVYTDFAPSLPVSSTESVSLTDGVMTLSAKGSVYAPCKGTVSAITESEDGKFNIELTHNDIFKTVFSGVDYAYFATGDSVFSTIPVGYTSGSGATMCFFDEDGQVITDYTLGDDGVVWTV